MWRLVVAWGILKTFNDNPYSMYKAFRTNTDEISKLENSIK